MHWDEMNEIWGLQGEPLRPPRQVVEAIVSEVALRGDLSTLILGVTPEYHGRFSRLTAIDGSVGMVKTVWPGNTENDRVEIGSWASLSKYVEKADAVIGDFSLGVVGDKFNVMNLLSSIRDVCVVGGLCLFRTWVRPDFPITERSLIKYCESETFSSHALRLRIGMYLAQNYGGAVPVSMIYKNFNEIFPCRHEFLRKTGINPNEIKLIDLYQHSDSVYFYPTRHEIIEMISQSGFSGEFVEVGGYDFSCDCPIVRMKG